MSDVRVWSTMEEIIETGEVKSRPATPADLLDALGFPSDEDVETAARAVAQERWGASELTTPRDQLIARAALQAVADARRTEEEG